MLQFISLYNQRKNDTAEELQWGDEIEYQLVAFDDESRTVRISLRADEILADLSAKERLYGRRDGFGEACAWHPEYGAWMVEGTPRFPYSGSAADRTLTLTLTLTPTLTLTLTLTLSLSLTLTLAPNPSQASPRTCAASRPT